MASTATKAAPAPESDAAEPAERPFDGLICMGGGDWWYHNRGHYGMQLMARFRRRFPVLYVNSIGIRVPKPSEGRMFARRVARKLRSWARGFQRVDERFGVLSPVTIPGRLGMAVSERVLVAQVARAARRMGLRRPLFWVTCPPGVAVAERVPHAGLVYQRTDRWEEFPGADPALIRDCDRRLKALADVTLYCSTLLYDEERGANASARYVDHGVDFERFADAGRGLGSEPPEYAGLPRPRAGFVGGVDAHTFDARLFTEVARRLPDVQFVLVGAVSIDGPWRALPNVRELGRKPYEEVADHMAACDVLLMPWNRNEWIAACNPVKLKEYLAVGRPVVSTPFPELARYGGAIRAAGDAEEFAREVRATLAAPGEPEPRRALVAAESWDSRAEAVLRFLREAGLGQRPTQ